MELEAYQEDMNKKRNAEAIRQSLLDEDFELESLGIYDSLQ